ncbi:nitrate- and nitrite sensing domain-containing protein [Micromonospora sp. CPCC 206061]|uniref:nitrate- and nitrite sensing domain-containing protein n=1 Tax=Micromonospora sp. CPCC 206061 TaxID=3122410 RepID=UPI002FF06D90
MTEHPTHARPGRRRPWLRNRRIRTKLAIILALPIFAVTSLTALTIVSAAQRATEADQARGMVVLGGTGARLAERLQQERAAAALVFAESSRAEAVAGYQRAAAATDWLVTEFQAERARTRLPDTARSLLARIDDELAGLVSLRQKVVAAPDAVLSVVVFRYRAVIADVLAYRQALGQVSASASTANGLRAAASLSQAIESLGQLQTATIRTLAAGRLTPAGQQEIVGADTGISEALQAFSDLGPAHWPAVLNTRIGGGQKILESERLQGVATRAQPGARLELDTDARGWSTAIAARMELMHAVEANLDGELLTAVTAERDAQLRTIFVNSGGVGLVVLIAVVVGWWVAKSLTGSLTRLQASAFAVAVRRLPGMVQQLDIDHADPQTVHRLVEEAAAPIPVDGTDEVGRVAEAFNLVTKSAARLAGEQAGLRAAVGAMFVALSRRLQLRADAMMVSLDGLERDEQDPERLRKLFVLDHTAVLIRRFIANLLILGGGLAGRPREGTERLPAVLQAAGQGIEAYARVDVTDADDNVQVSGQVVDELIHMLSELLDNAAHFSPPETRVEIEGRRVGDQLHIQVRDQGIGMGEAELRAARERVANPLRLDHRTTQQMGLPAVGAVAHRLGIKIEFRSQPGAGTRVDVTVPNKWFTSQAPVVEQETTELRAISAEVSAAPPPTWPPPSPAAAQPTAEPVIFEQMRNDRSWFRPGDGDGAAPPAERAPVGAATAWAAVASATTLDVSAAPEQRTASGLPIRQPRRAAMPPASSQTAAPAKPVPRQPDRVRAQMAAYQHGLTRAARRQTHNVARTTEP